MKTLKLKLKKKVLIIDAENCGYISDTSLVVLGGTIYNLPEDYEFLCKGSELTEEIASELVEMEYSGLYKKSFYIDYDRPSLLLKFAKESFISAVESKGFYWLENPIEIIERGEDTEHNRVLNQNKWQEAEEKTFKNPLIFIKNYVQ